MSTSCHLLLICKESAIGGKAEAQLHCYWCSLRPAAVVSIQRLAHRHRDTGVTVQTLSAAGVHNHHQFPLVLQDTAGGQRLSVCGLCCFLHLCRCPTIRAHSLFRLQPPVSNDCPGTLLCQVPDAASSRLYLLQGGAWGESELGWQWWNELQDCHIAGDATIVDAMLVSPHMYTPLKEYLRLTVMQKQACI